MIHLIKLAVGPESLTDLVERQARRLQDMKAAGKKPELIHVTRYRPKRAKEALDGGSLYWVIKGRIVARQKLLELRPVKKNDAVYCGLIFDHRVVAVDPRAHRPFQGWRYFSPADAPRDLTKREADKALPAELREELAEFGVI